MPGRSSGRSSGRGSRERGRSAGGSPLGGGSSRGSVRSRLRTRGRALARTGRALGRQLRRAASAIGVDAPLRRIAGATPRSGALAWILAFLVAYGWLVREVALGRPYAFGDLSPVAGRAALALFTETWHHRLLGYPHQFSAMVAYQGAVTLAGQAVGAGALAQNLFYLALVPACFGSFAVFTRRFLPDPAARYAAAGVYAVNPVTVGEFVNGGANEFLALVGGPLVLHWLWRVAETDRWRPALAAGAAFGATAVVPWTAFWTIAPFCAVLSWRERGRPAVLGKFVAAGLVGVVLALPSVYYLLQRASALGASELLYTQLRWNYRAATVPALLRLAGNHGSYAMAALGFNDGRALGFLLPAVAALGLVRRRLRFCAPIVAGLVAAAVAIHHGAADPLFAAVPPLWSLRNPAKLLFPLSLSMALLFGGGVDVLLAQVRTLAGHAAGEGAVRDRGRRDGSPLGCDGGAGGDRGGVSARLVGDGGTPRPLGLDSERVLRVAIVGLLVVSLAGYMAPAAGGGLGLEQTRGEQYAVPPAYDAVGERVDGRALWAPYSYTTQLRLRHAAPGHVGLRSGGVAQGKPGADLVTDLFRDVAAGERVAPRLRALGVTHVVVDANPQHRYPATRGPPRLAMRHSAPWLFGDPATFADRLAANGAFERAFTAGNLTVFRVRGAEARPPVAERSGLQRVWAPPTPRVTPLSGNLATNGDFADGLEGWWYWQGEGGTRTAVVRQDGDGAGTRDRAASLVTPDGSAYPIAQQVSVSERSPYRIEAAVGGEARVALYWYDGPKRPDTHVSTQVFPAGELPRVVTAKGSTLSLRFRPVDERVVVDDVAVRRTTYPPATDTLAAAEDVPGVVMPARTPNRSSAVDLERLSSGPGALVAVNVAPERAGRADVVVRDAETVLDGDLVFDETYRQGVAVRVDGELPEEVPEDARVHADRTTDGTVVDYWVTGRFDDTNVTVVDTAFHAGWEGAPGGTQVRAAGWANGFTATDPGDVRWTGGDRERRLVLGLWLFAWSATLGAIAASLARDALTDDRSRRRGRRGRGGHRGGGGRRGHGGMDAL